MYIINEQGFVYSFVTCVSISVLLVEREKSCCVCCLSSHCIFVVKNKGHWWYSLALQHNCLMCTAKQYTGVPCFISTLVVRLALQNSCLICTVKQFTGVPCFISIFLCHLPSNNRIYCLFFCHLFVFIH